MHANVDESVRHTPLTTAVIVLAGALGQGLERRAHRRPSDLVEHAVDEDHAIVTVGKVEAARLNALSLVLGAALGVSRVPSVVAGVVETGDGLLARLAEKLGLVEALADRGRGPRDERKVGETDLPLAQSVRALAQMLQLLAGADPSAGSPAAH